MPDGRYEHVINGQVIAVTKVFYDPAKHEACALLTKDKANGGFGTSSYLALTLCNSAGVFPMCPSVPIPRICRSTPPAWAIAAS